MEYCIQSFNEMCPGIAVSFIIISFFGLSGNMKAFGTERPGCPEPRCVSGVFRDRLSVRYDLFSSGCWRQMSLSCFFLFHSIPSEKKKGLMEHMLRKAGEMKWNDPVFRRIIL